MKELVSYYNLSGNTHDVRVPTSSKAFAFFYLFLHLLGPKLWRRDRVTASQAEVSGLKPDRVVVLIKILLREMLEQNLSR